MENARRVSERVVKCLYEIIRIISTAMAMAVAVSLVVVVVAASLAVVVVMAASLLRLIVVVVMNNDDGGFVRGMCMGAMM